MFDAIDTATQRKLWPHQTKALDFAIDHLNQLNSPCLIRMPTGTGKTGVIACLTRLSNPGASLVLTPWAHLRDQMVADLVSAFWSKLQLRPPPRTIQPMLPSTAKDVLNSTAPQVIVATFATLNELRLDHADLYRKLSSTVSLVLVDEGHYEPAVEWGKSVKGLGRKTVLLTATPYRNDLKLFRISDPQRSAHHFTHRDAVQKGIIRTLRFEALPDTTDMNALASGFAVAWRRVKRAGTLASASPRAIICCADASQIETVVARLRGAGLDAIGIHEQFEHSKDPSLLKDVPDPKRTGADIWVHQHKLTEGLDDHRFCCVALFTRFRNDRKLIQQIGRILRRDAGDRNAAAVLLAPPAYSPEASWNAYLEFETDLTLLEPTHFRDVVEALLKSQPAVEYFEGRFRRRFNAGALPSAGQVIIAPSVLVRAPGREFSLPEYIEDCTDTLNTEDAVILGPELNGPCQRTGSFALWVYASVRNSRLLQSTSLYEVRLETHCVVVAAGYVFVADSRGIVPEECLADQTTAVPADALVRFLDQSFRLTNVSVDSSIPYDTVLRGADLRGHNLLNVAASLTDRVHICRAARGSSSSHGRRYVGLSNARLRKEPSAEERRTFDLTQFVSWAQSVAKILGSGIAASPLFKRYMPICAPPSDPVPRTICIDLLRLEVSLTVADGDQCHLKSSSANIKSSVSAKRTLYRFELEVEKSSGESGSITLQLEYQSHKQRFWFYKEEGTSVRVTLADDDESRDKSFAEFLNQKQEIVLIGLEGGEIVYQGRNFYKVDYSYAEQVLLDLIVRPTNTPHCRSEKGTRQELAAAKHLKATAFPHDCLFRQIVDRTIGFPFADEILICADLGTECADFIAASLDKGHMALIHAKAGSGHNISASAFHDVVAQAMKNLLYLTSNAGDPPGASSWRQGSLWNQTGIQRLCRAPPGLPSGAQLWQRLRAEIIRSSSPELYVVLVTTGCCDRNVLQQAISDAAQRTPETGQLLHLLDGLNGYARQLGLRLVIYDLPYQKPQKKQQKKPRKPRRAPP
jgi:superfamily II DNA or RNA helicase